MAEIAFKRTNLQRALTQLFTKQVAKRGKRLFEDHCVISVSTDQHKVIGLVLGSQPYHVRLQLTEGEVDFTECDCPYGYECKHAAALIYYLLDELPPTTQRKVESHGARGSLHRSGQFTRIPDELDGSAQDFLVFRGPGRHRWEPSRVVRHEFLSEREIKSYLYLKDYRGLTPEGSTTMCHQDDEVQIKCHECDVRVEHLCQHQRAVLKQFAGSKFGAMWLRQPLEYNYEQHVRGLAEERQMSPENFLKSFQIFLEGDSFYIKTKIDGQLINMPKDEIHLMLREGMELPVPPSLDDQMNVFEKKILFGNAFVWQNQSYYTESRLTLVEGKLDKLKSKLASYIKEITYPNTLSHELTSLYGTLKQTLEMESSKQTISPALKLMKEHSALLMGSLNYRLREDLHRAAYDWQIRKKDLVQIYFTGQLAGIEIKSYIQDDLIVVEARPRLADEIVNYDKITYLHDYFVTDQQQRAYLFDQFLTGRALQFFRENPRLLFFQSELEKYVTLIAELGQHFTIDTDISFISQAEIQQVKKRIYLRESDHGLAFRPVLVHGEVMLSPAQRSHVISGGGKIAIWHLPDGVMDDFLSEVRLLHPHWAHETKATTFLLETTEVMRDLWFLKFYEQCGAQDIEVFGQEELAKFKYSKHRAKVSSQIKSGIDWFDLEVSVEFGDQQLRTKDWLTAIRNNTRYVQLKDGTVGILPEAWFNRFRKLEKTITMDGGEAKVSKLNFNVIEQLFEERDFDLEVMEDIQRKKKKLASYTKERKYRFPKAIQANLRNYQKEGFKWLKFLQEFGFGGCLADDMGLGKTLQAICILADQQGQGTHLVVAPRTLLFTWSAELEKFCPDLKYLIHHGPFRTKNTDGFSDFDVLISTYDTVASDISFFSTYPFNYVVLDESQAIKNPNSKRYKAMCLLQARNKLVMTGTPIENSTFDLYAQMNFVNPGFLGNMTSFKNQYVLAIEKHGDQETAALLQKMIHPFVLRRTKQQVASDLPEKTESILWCEMESNQRRQYDELKRQIREQVNKKMDQVGAAKSKMVVLEGLLRLRQMCNAPELLDANLTKREKQSVKIQTLLEQCKYELGNHSALIFSQFVSMLKIIREQLDAEQIPYAYLDGSTRDREKAVRQFNEEDDRRIFLISLKAGNTGLNLVKADYVYIVDPWWNPAVEAQAIDRTHRIGQDKHIFAYKMICKDSIEEKILKLQEKKKKLASDIIQTDASVFKSLDKEELLALFD